MKLIISNHKEGLIDDKYKSDILELLNPRIELIVCPNDKQLLSFKKTNYSLGSQDVDYCFSTDELKKMAVKYTIVGHSDKRKKYHETNKDVNEKVKKLLEYGICPIVCIGEEKEELEVKEIIDKELEECLEKVNANNIIIAYEPVWAIGSGKIPDMNKLANIIRHIKYKTKELIDIYPLVVYGGSVNEDTIESLEKVLELDGYLIGSASLDINRLKSLIEVVK